MEYIKILEQITTRGGPPGGHNPPGRPRRPRRALVGAALLGPPPVPIFWYIGHVDLERIRRGLLGWSTAVSRWNLGRSTFVLRWSDSAGGTDLDPNHHHHQQLPRIREGNLHQDLQQNHLLLNPSSSLVFNLCTGTIDWCLWVTSSVDYIL